MKTENGPVQPNHRRLNNIFLRVLFVRVRWKDTKSYLNLNSLYYIMNSVRKCYSLLFNKRVVGFDEIESLNLSQTAKISRFSAKNPAKPSETARIHLNLGK